MLHEEKLGSYYLLSWVPFFQSIGKEREYLRWHKYFIGFKEQGKRPELKIEGHSSPSSTLLRVLMANPKHTVAQRAGISPLAKALKSVRWFPIFSPRIIFTYF